ncbi:PREDICTED: DNA topoisomerase 3-alpha isoform X1 [Cyphomyrmex costatus]|uniref:DNA topoisomerase 3-alpha isoform X1 n=1 Tax=Cyphomyrmex costatus TaxID=456900 RepID=UPI00085229DE|nr:PREDICTED: DNA topoisomerase 3-alpha isoform X1 [Cyphomyrmex costatus]
MAFFKSYTIALNCTIYHNLKNKASILSSNNPGNVFCSLRQYCSKSIMKVLNVAEKPDAAKNIAGYLSHGTSRRREGFSKYNKIFEFNVQLWGQNCQMVMTSVSGHLLGHEFTGGYNKWHSCHPLNLFDATVSKQCLEESHINIKKTLEREVRSCNTLIIWTDCDREGENIGFEIIQVCQAVKPHIHIYRAKFSEITRPSIERALQTLTQPDKAMSDAVDVRSELDLRIGAAFTRFQTLRLQKVFPNTLGDLLISYGSCQFPTLGFVVERFLAIDRFKSEPYWKLKVMDDHEGISVEFRWARVRLFEKVPCQIFLDICLEQPEATVEKVTCKPKSKWRPLPLDTVELEKQGSRKLRINAKETMRIAERLYTQGFISYPRTETNIFPKELNLRSLVEQQVNNQEWGNFAENLLESGITPRQGKKSDQAHPPIHPTKYTDSLHGNEAKIYEFVVRHFLACLSKNAEGRETTIEINIAGEKFMANGLEIIATNYLDVYIYEKWNNKQIHFYEQQQVFRPTSIDMVEEKTSAPSLLTEAELIALMDKHGIGTDATHAEHIDTIKSRQYVGLTDTQHFMPGKLGIGLVMGYDNMGFQMSKPHLRADLEKDLQLICQRQKDPNEVLQHQINKYREVFQVAIERANLIDDSLAHYLDERPLQTEGTQLAPMITTIFKCPKCGSDMILKQRRQGRGKYITCLGYPACTNVIWFSEAVEDVEVLNETCNLCTENIRKLKFKLVRNVIPLYGTSYTTCIGCDTTFNEMLNIKEDCIKQTGRANYTVHNNTRDILSSASNTSLPTSSTSQSRNTQPISSSTEFVQNNNISLIGTSATSRRPNTQNQNSNISQPNSSNRPSTINRNTTSDNRENHFSWINSDFNNPGNRANQSTFRNPHNTNNVKDIWGNTDDDAEIMCHCHEIAIQLTVRKEGPNKGRLFYKCAKPQGSGCSFFLWGSDSAESNTTNEHSSWESSWNRNNDGASTSNNDWGNPSMNNIMCNCNQPARKLTVYKDGPNKGRHFYGCPKGVGSTCNFFKWADENDADDNHTDWSNSTARGTGNRARNKFPQKGSAPKRPRPTGGKRKCGNCGLEGHTKKKCPNNAMD